VAFGFIDSTLWSLRCSDVGSGEASRRKGVMASCWSIAFCGSFASFFVGVVGFFAVAVEVIGMGWTYRFCSAVGLG
jgi:hypothetical protein